MRVAHGGTRAGSGRPCSLTADQAADLTRAYRAARAANGGETPRGWVSEQARFYAVTPRTLYRALESEQIDILTGKVAGAASNQVTPRWRYR